MGTKTTSPILSTLLRVQAVGPGYLMLKNPEQYVACYRIQGGAKPWNDSQATTNFYLTQFEDALNQLRPDEQVQFLIRRVPARVDKYLDYYEKNVNPGAPEEFRNEYVDYFKTWAKNDTKWSSLNSFETYLLFTITQKGGIVSLKGGAKRDSENVEYIRQRARSWCAGLSSSKITCNEMSENEIVQLLYEEINITEKKIDPKILLKSPTNPGGTGSLLSFREKLAAAPTTFYSDYMVVGNTFAKTFYVSDFSSSEDDPMFLGHLTQFRIPFKVSIFVRGLEQTVAKKKIESQLMGDKGTRKKNDQLVDFENIEKGERREGALNLLARGKTKLIKYSIYVTIYSKDPNELLELVDNFESRFAGIHSLNGKYEQRRLFISALPQCDNQAEDRVFVQTTNDLSNCWPFFHDNLTDGEGIPYGVSHMGEIVPVNPWSGSDDITNWNSVIMGAPGEGKSFSILLQLLRFLPHFPYVRIIDKSKSYEFICKMCGGYYVKINFDSKEKVNFFDVDIDEVIENGNKTPPNKITDLISYLTILLSEEKRATLDQLVEALLIDAIVKTYARFIPKLIESKERGKEALKLMPRLRDLKETLQEMGESKKDLGNFPKEFKDICLKYAKILEAYTGDGPYAGLTDCHSTIDPKSHFIVFDLSEIPDTEKFMALGTYIVSQFCLKQALEIKRQETEILKEKQRLGVSYIPRRSWLIIDEAWTLAKYAAGRSFLQEVAKRSRHLAIGSIFATQELKDFLSEPQIESVLNLANTKMIFQPKDEFELVAKKFSLNDLERTHVSRLHQVRGRFSQCFMMKGTKYRGLVYITPDPVSYWIATTHSDESREREVYLDKYAPSQNLTELWTAIFKLAGFKWEQAMKGTR